MNHCMPDYSKTAQYHTCVKCAHPLRDNQLVKDAFIQNGTVAWAKQSLRIIVEMLSEKERDQKWIIKELKKILDGLECLEERRP